jgi:uncharacterized membrane protein YedE/YeeE
MKYIKFLSVGILFGIILSKAEVISWFRIYEMFRFESFHMYGIIGSAIATGIFSIALIKKTNMKDMFGKEITFNPKGKSVIRYLLGGSIFGLGWAMTGACPGPMFILLGHGVYSILIVILFAIIGTFLYGILKDKLPH